MQFNEEKPNATYTIQNYQAGAIQVQNELLTKPFIISPHTLIKDWSAVSFASLSPEQLEPLFALDSDVILLGVGESADLPSPSLYKALVEHGVGFEIMTTAAACRTYTILLADNRKVVAALFP